MSAAEGSAPGEPTDVTDDGDAQPSPQPSPARPRCLVVDDERAILSALRKVLGKERFDVITLDAPHPALDLIREQAIDVVLLDIRMPGMSGLELLKAIKELVPDVEVIMMTAFATVETALEAVRAGAFDYLTKPFENIDRVVQVVERAVERRLLIHKTRDLERELASHQRFSTLIGSAPEMREVYNLIESVAATPANVLIRGETGTGKELVARAIHERSDRSAARMVTVNCSALTETLLESELFGHKKGSFTGALSDKKGLFEAAHQGTLFLDELGDMALATQVKLLRVLQSGEVRPIGSNEPVFVDVRVVAATHVDLEAAMKDGRFRQDLYWRLNVIRIDLPALRERAEDIPLLAQSFLERAAAQFDKTVSTIAPEALNCLVAHEWAGNVRELENVIERAVVLTRSDTIGLEQLPERVRGRAAVDGPPVETKSAAANGHGGGMEMSPLLEMPFREAKDTAIRSFERLYVEGLLSETGGNISDAARRAGLDRSNFRRILNKHEVDATAFKR